MTDLASIDVEVHEFEMGMRTGKLFAPSPYWLAGYMLGTWRGIMEKLWRQ